MIKYIKKIINRLIVEVAFICLHLRNKPIHRWWSGKRYLIVFPKYQFPSHLNTFEIFSEFLRYNDGAKIDALICNMGVSACDDLSLALNGEIDEVKDWTSGCGKCVRYLKRRYQLFCDDLIYQSKFITNEDYRIADDFVRSFGYRIGRDEYLNIMYDGIDIGRYAFESFQRYFKLGSVNELYLNSGTAAYEFLKSAILQVISARRLLVNYEMIILHEHTYSQYGTWMSVAASMKMKIFRTSYNDIKGPKFPDRFKNIICRVGTDRKCGLRLMEFPGFDKVDDVFNNPDLLDRYAKKGFDILRQNLGGKSPAKTELYSKLNIPEGSYVVCVFTHLCWDAALSFGKSIFNTFDDWLSVTYKEAIRLKDVYWLFKIHPAEIAKHVVHPRYNTLNFLKELVGDNVSDNIRIIDSVDIKTWNLRHIIKAGITNGGTVSYELPSFGVNCISVNKGMHSQLGFTVDCESKEHYIELLRSIKHLKPLTEKQIDKSRAYAAMLNEDDISINIKEVFQNNNYSPQFLLPNKVKRLVKNKNSEFKRMLQRKYY